MWEWYVLRKEGRISVDENYLWIIYAGKETQKFG